MRGRPAPEPREARLPLEVIVIGQRHRQRLGDIEGLAESIARVGLLHPPVITPDRRLISEERRIEAAQLLGWADSEHGGTAPGSRTPMRSDALMWTGVRVVNRVTRP